MSLNSFFQFFVPKETKFYPLYIQQAEYIEKATKLLWQMMSETDLQQLDNQRKEIKACETGGDQVLRDFYSQLFNTVLTPFEREDVHELAEMMDNFLDRIDDTANIILTRRFTDVDEALTTMTANVMFAAENLTTIIRDLPMMDKKRRKLRVCATKSRVWRTTTTNFTAITSANCSSKTTASTTSSSARTWCRSLRTPPIR